MTKYLMQHRIRTKAKCEKPFEFEDIHFEHYSFNIQEGWLTDYWLAKGEVEANSWHEAANIFREKLGSILPKIAFISQCALEFGLEPLLVLNPDYKEKIVFICHTKDVDGTGLHFGENEIQALKAIHKSDLAISFFEFMADSANASTLHTTLYMLFAALEGLTQIEKIVKCQNCKFEREVNGVDSTILRGILGGKLYNQCWGADGLRHKMSHGDFPKVPPDLKKEVYEKIVSYINQEYNISINENVVHPQRGFTGKKNRGVNFYRYFGESKDLNLKECCEFLDKSLLGEEGKLEHVGPDQYKIDY